MSSAPPQDTESTATVPTGNPRRSLGRPIAYGLATVGLVATSMAAGWMLQSRLRPATADATVHAPAPPEHGEPGHALPPHTGEPPGVEPVGEVTHGTGEDRAHTEQQTAMDGAPAPQGIAPHAEPPAGIAEGHETIDLSLPPANEVAPAAEELARAFASGEEALENGDAPAALREFDWVAKYQDRSLDDRFRLRCGVCAESLGDLDRALEEYGAALATATDETVITHCRLGQARVWRSLGHPEMATHLLASAFLTNGNAQRAPVVRPFVAYLFADVLASEGIDHEASAPIEDDGLQFPNWKFDLFERTLQSSLRRGADSQATPPAGVRIVSDGNAPEIVLQANLPRMGLRNIVEALCREMNRRVTWSAAARQSTAGRTSEICVARCSFSLCLDAITAPVGVTWTEHGDEIQFEAVTELDAARLRTHRREAARRAMTHAVQEHPHFMLAPQALVTLGNLAFLSGRTDDAAASYTQVFATSPRSPICADAWFNLAKLELNREQPVAALEAFWRAVDSGAAPKSASIAYLFIGRLLLDAEQPRRAIVPLTRAIQGTTESAVRSRAVVTLAVAHLFHGNPKAANEVLMDFRSNVEQLSQQAAYLSALARYRFTDNPARKLNEGQSLLAAAKSLRPDDLFGRYGWYLCGHTYQDLLLPELAVEVYREGLSRFEHVPYRNAIVFGLATSLADSGDGEAAQQYLNELLQQPDPDWQRSAAFRLCRLQLDRDQPLQASHTARALLELCTTTDDKTRALQSLGAAYQRMGDHAAAALCFAGSTPGAASADAGEP